jgi:hypothetical protein
VALLAFYPAVPEAVLAGNPVIWALAFGMAAAAFGAAGPFILFKPTLALFAVLGAWRRSWWVWLGVLAVAVVAFAPMWPDYLAVVRNVRGRPGFFLHDWPIMLIPTVLLVARQTARRPPSEQDRVTGEQTG